MAYGVSGVYRVARVSGVHIAFGFWGFLVLVGFQRVYGFVIGLLYRV